MLNIQNVYKSLPFLLFLSVQIPVFAKGIRITTDAPAKVWTNERFTLTYTIESGEEIESIYDASKKDSSLIIISGPIISRSVFRSRQNPGGLLYKINVVYKLQLKDKGKHILPGIEVVYKNKTEKTVKQVVDVIPLDDEKQDEVAFIKTSLSRSKVKPGDTLSVYYKLFTTLDISRVRWSRIPNVKGLSITNTTKRGLTYKEEEKEGKKYKVIEILSLIIQPEDEGRFTIPGGQAEIEFSIPTGKSRKDFWGEEHEERISKSVLIPFGEFNISAFDLIII